MDIEWAKGGGAAGSYCGERAADAGTAAALIAVGVRQFSLPASSIGPFRRLVRSLDAGAAAAWLDAQFGNSPASLRADFTNYLKSAGAAL